MNIKYFGILAEITGQDEEFWEAEDMMNISLLQQQLENKYPALSAQAYRVVVNQKIETGDQGIQAGDEIALLPPFAGG